MKRYLFRLETEARKRVESVQVKAVMVDAVGSFSFTDVMLQDGEQLTGYS